MIGTLPSVTLLRNDQITRGNVSGRNALRMSAAEIRDKWRQAHEPHERLRWARMHWQASAGSVGGSAKNAADSMGMEPGTYRAYERDPASSKSIALDHQAAIRFGKKFKVDWQWLLLGDGTPFDNQLSPELERIVKIMSQASEDRQRLLADAFEAIAKVSGVEQRTGTDG